MNARFYSRQSYDYKLSRYCQDGLLVLCGFLRSKDKFVASHRWISSFDISAAENPDLVGFGEFVHQREDVNDKPGGILTS